jgi:hypothetical protein
MPLPAGGERTVALNQVALTQALMRVAIRALFVESRRGVLSFSRALRKKKQRSARRLRKKKQRSENTESRT